MDRRESGFVCLCVPVRATGSNMPMLPPFIMFSAGEERGPVCVGTNQREIA